MGKQIEDWQTFEKNLRDFISSPEEPGDNPEEEQSEDGAIWVTDGEIQVKDPKGQGKYPVLIKTPAVRLWVDGIEVKDRQIVTTDSAIRYELETFPAEAKMTITFSTDQVEAYLNLTYTNGIEYGLAPQKPKQALRLETEYAQEIEPPSLTLENVLEKARHMGITLPLETEMAQWALQEKESGSYLLAKGKNAVDGLDEGLVFPSRDSLNKPLDGKEPVNFRDRGEILSVEMGDLVAVKTLGSPGIPGLTVKGEVIPARGGLVLEVQEGHGIKAMDGGRKFVATAAGRPKWNPVSKVLEILPRYELIGNVDMHTGNIAFRGDVYIKGIVCEGFQVKALGEIIIEGAVFGGQVHAGSHIMVTGNVISATLEAGGEGAILKQTLNYLIPLKNLMYDCYKAIGELKKNQSFSSVDLKISGVGNLIKLLIDIKFRDIPRFVGKLKEIVRSRKEIDEQLVMMTMRLENALTGLGPLQFVGVEEFFELYEEVSSLVDYIQDLVSHLANVTVKSVQNSTIRATGSIQVVGRGVVNSNLFAGEDITASGAFRGGIGNAVRKIAVGELGSEAEVHTQALVSSDGRITARKVYTGVVLGADRFHTRNVRVGFGLNCYFDQKRGIVVEMEREDKSESKM